MKHKLKPCPFCGSYKVYGVTLNDKTRLFREYVCCDVCGSSTTTHETKKKAIEAWNTRAERTCEFVASETFDEWEIVCTACKSRLDWTISGSNYCPECGARLVHE